MADISTPIVVPWKASRNRGRAAGSAAARIARQATARMTIDRHISARPRSTHTGCERTSVERIESIPMRWSASQLPIAAPPAAAPRTARRITRRTVCERAGAGSSDGRRRAGRRGPRSAGRTPRRTAARVAPPSGAGTARASS